jgi:hypothetical protein
LLGAFLKSWQSTLEPAEQSAYGIVDRESAAAALVEEGLPSTEDVATDAAVKLC